MILLIFSISIPFKFSCLDLSDQEIVENKIHSGTPKTNFKRPTAKNVKSGILSIKNYKKKDSGLFLIFNCLY